MTDPVIVKVGGSLYERTDLAPRLTRLLARPDLQPTLLVPGGGKLADDVRRLDRLHRLGQEASHWLALNVLSVNATFLARLLPGSHVVPGPEEALPVWECGGVAILDACRFAEADESRPGALPHSWQVTSDSIAARLAVVCQARKLVLLKSVSFPEPIDWVEASRQGFVDEWFVKVLEQAANLEIEAINLRSGQREM